MNQCSKPTNIPDGIPSEPPNTATSNPKPDEQHSSDDSGPTTLPMASTSSIVLLNTQCCNPSAQSPARWKIPYLRDKLQEISESRVVPFIALTETWLKSYISDAQIDIEHFNVYRSDRDARRGGGVMLYTHESIPTTDVQKYDDKISQVLICRFDTIKMIVSVIYRPPDTPTSGMHEHHSSSYINDKDDYESCIVGDFNLPDVDWSSSTISPSSSPLDKIASELAFQFMDDHLHNQFVHEATRGENTLDFLLSNSANLVSHVSISDTPLSDHRLLEVHISHNPCQPIEPQPPDFLSSSFRSLDFSNVNLIDINSTGKNFGTSATMPASFQSSYRWSSYRSVNSNVLEKYLHRRSNVIPSELSPEKRGG